MKKTILAVMVFAALSLPAAAEMLLFVDKDCHFCNDLKSELEKLNYYSEFDIQEYDVLSSEESASLYLEKIKEVGYGGDQVPLLIDGGYFTGGKDSILEYLGSQKTLEISDNETPLLTTEESEELKQILEETPQNEIQKEIPDLPKSEKAEKTIGIIAILFGLTLFGTIIYKAKRRKH